jgi:hypothetical protein
MDGFFSSGSVIDAVLLFIAAEAAWLIFTRGRDKAFSILIALAPGVCLLLAARTALTDAGWMWTAAWVTASLPFHLLDLKLRPPK